MQLTRSRWSRRSRRAPTRITLLPQLVPGGHVVRRCALCTARARSATSSTSSTRIRALSRQAVAEPTTRDVESDPAMLRYTGRSGVDGSGARSGHPPLLQARPGPSSFGRIPASRNVQARREGSPAAEDAAPGLATLASSASMMARALTAQPSISSSLRPSRAASRGRRPLFARRFASPSTVLGARLAICITG